MSRRALFAAAAAGMFVFGTTLAILGVLFGMPAMRARMHADLAQQGDILFVLYAGVLLSTIIAGPVIDHFGNKVVLRVAALTVLAGLLALAAARSFSAASIAAFVMGFGGGGLNTSANALVAEIYPEHRGAMLNLVAVFFGLGALVAPVIAVVAAARLTIVCAALAAACTIFYFALRFPPAAETQGFSIFASIKAVRYPGVMLFAWLLFCESGNESAIGGWTSTYAGSIGASPALATWILAGYWAGLMSGRIAGVKLASAMSKPRLLLLCGIGSAIGTALLILWPSVIAAFIIGLSFAAIYPTTLAIAADRYQRLAGTIFGLLFAVGLIGGMIFPWAVGQLSERFGVRPAMTLPLAGAIVIMILVTLIRKRAAAEPRAYPSESSVL
ncbi:MAG TPA: MFS transporter [Thermoanaerobaculia bacterium]|nr:MFS transporter [Thermoanaerobaculia bacterium]